LKELRLNDLSELTLRVAHVSQDCDGRLGICHSNRAEIPETGVNSRRKIKATNQLLDEFGS
jgi:hypothetical protein